MKSLLQKGLFTLVFTIALMLASQTAFAWHHHGYWHHRGYWGGGVVVGAPYYGGYYSRCRWVPEHYNRYGYWVPGHRACW